MDPTYFCYWLKGFFEISDSNELTPKQVQIIRDHIDLVFNKVTPDRRPAVKGLDLSKTMFQPNHLINTQPIEPGKLCSPNTPICQPAIDKVTFGDPEPGQVTVYC